jgi:type VI secretion system protein
MSRRVAGSVVVTVTVLTLSCAITARSARLQLQVHVAPDVNDDRPIPVDVVFVWDKATVAKVEALSAKDWFDRKIALRRDDPNERAFTIRDWEWVPGQEVPDIDLSVRATSRRWLKAIFVFANYRTDGPHRARVSPGSATLALLKDDFRIQPAAAAPKAPVSDDKEH